MLMRIITRAKEILKNNLLLAFFCFAAHVSAQCPTVANTAQTFCDVESPTIASLQATDTGGGIAWFATASSTTPLASFTGLVNGEDYFVDNSSGNCGSRTRVVVTIYAAPTGLSFQGVCVGVATSATLANLSVSGNNIQWYDQPTGGTSLPLTTQLVDGTIYYASQTNPNTGCETSRFSVFVNVGIVPVPTGNPAQVFCNTPGNPPTVANLQPNAANIRWYATISSATPLTPTTPLVNGQSYFATTVDPPCESNNRLQVEVTIQQPNNSGTSGVRSICISDVATYPAFNLFSDLAGNPDITGTWSGPLTTTNGHLGTVNINSLTVAGSPYVFTYSVSSSACPTVASTVTINILPLPTASLLVANATICSGTSATVNFTGTPNATVTYNINSGANQTITLNASGTAVLTSNYTATSNINLISVASQGPPVCVQPLSGSGLITVLPLPTVTISSNVSICRGSSATVTFTGTPNATVTYTVNSGANQTIVLNASGTATITNTYNATTTFSLVSVASATTPVCSQPQAGSMVITVIPPPTVTIGSNVNICPNSSATITFTGTPNAVVTYTVNGGANQMITLDASGNANITNTYTTTTVFALVSVATSGTPVCTQPASGTATITVLLLPTASVASSTTICSGATASVTFTGTPNATVTYTINGGLNQTITLNASGTATLSNTYTATTNIVLVSVASAGTPSCTQPLTGSVTINVIPLPVVTISSSATVCPNSPAVVTFTGTPNAVVTYTINGGNNQTITLNASGTATISNTYTTTTVYNLVSVATAGTPSCSQPQTGTVTITVLPLPTASISSSQTICTGSNASVTFAGTPNSVVTYTINGGSNQTITLNASGNATLTNNYNATTVFALVSVTTSGTPSCTQPLTGSVTITVVDLPVVSIAVDVTTICSGQTALVTFTGTPNAVVTYSVNGGSNQTINLDAVGTATLNNTYTADTTITLVSAATNSTPSCSQPQTGSIAITVLPLPVVNISTTTTSVCAGASATVTFTGTPNATVTYTVNAGGNQTIVLDSTGTATITDVFNTSTVYTLLDVTSAGTPSCNQPQNGSITINVIDLPTVSLSNNTTICFGTSTTVTFTGTSNSVVTYTVNGGSNQTILLNNSGTATISDTYTATTVFALVSIATSGAPSCTQLQTGTMTITVDPVPSVSISGGSAICAGDSASVTFTGTPNATVSFTVGGSSQTIVLDAAGNGVYTQTYATTTTVSLVSITTAGTPGCSQPQSGDIVITVAPLPTVSISAPASVCLGSITTVTLTGTPNATVTYTINAGANQSLVLDASGTTVLTTPSLSATTTYTLVSVVSAGSPACTNLLTNSVTINVNPLPTATISSSGTVCSGTSAAILFTGTPNSTVTYNNGTTNATITIGATGTATLNIPLTVTTTFTLVSIVTNNPPACSQNLTGSTTLQVTQPPVAGSNAAYTTCTNGPTQDLFVLLGPNAQPGGTWSPALHSGTNIFDPQFDTAASYQYLVAGTPPCVNDTAVVFITYITAPNAGTNGTANLCSNISPVDLTTYLGGIPQAGGTWSPALASGTNLFNPAVDTAGTYTYTVTGTAPCGSASANVVVTITQGPEAGVDASVTVCVNNPTFNLFPLLGTTAQPGGTWSPALASGTDLFNPAVDVSSVYTYTLSGNNPCDNDTATVTVIVNPVPDAGQDASTDICSNAAPIDLLTRLGGTPQNGGTWSPALTSGTNLFDPSVDLAGTYTYTVGAPFCNPAQATLTISIVQGPEAGVNATATFCITDAPSDLFTLLGPTAQTGGVWSPAMASGTGVFDPAVDAATVYTYTLSGNDPCDNDSATVNVTVNPLPNAGTALANQTVCNSQATLDLNSLLNGAQSGGTWTDSASATVSNIVDVSNLAATTYSYTYTVINTCGSDDEPVSFTVLPNPVLTGANIQVSSPNCKGDNVTVTFNNMVDGSYTLNYDLSISNVLTAQSTQVVISGGTGIMTISGNDLPNTGNTRITFTNITNSVTTCTVPINPSVSADFIIKPTSNLVSANLSIADVCAGNGVTVLISGATGLTDGDYQFVYDIPQATPTTATTAVIAIAGGVGQFDVPASVLNLTGQYDLTITSIVSLSGGCNNTAENAQAQFTVYPVPDLNGAVLTAADICLGEDNTISINTALNLVDGDYTITYELSGASTLTNTALVTIAAGQGSFLIPASEINTSGNVGVNITQIVSQLGSCSNTGAGLTPVDFDIAPLVGTPTLVEGGNKFCAPTNPTIANLTSNITGSDTVLWYDAPTGGNLYVSTTSLIDGGTYYAAYQSAAGCESSARLSVTVTLDPCDDILIPDGFSPNGDQVNDTFEIKNLATKYPKFKLEIYNRYGNILYKGDINTPNWDGTNNEGGVKLGSSTLPTGVYFYVLEFNDGTTKDKQGRLYLSR